MRRLKPIARVSTKKQLEQYSPESQVSAAIAYIESIGAEPALPPIVVAESGTTMDRADIDEVVALLKSGQIDGVVYLNRDRFSRAELLHTLMARAQIWQHGGELHYVQGGLAERTPEDEFVDNVLLGYGRLNVQKLKSDMLRGRKQKARRGLIPGQRGIKYGYTLNRETWQAEIHPRHAVIVRQIRRLYARGTSAQGKRLGMGAIARLLEARGIPSPSGRPRWSTGTLYDIVRDTTYSTGILYFNQTNLDAQGRQVPTPREQWIPVRVPVIDKAGAYIQDLIDERLKTGMAMSTRNQVRAYLLRCRLRCHHCGWSLIGRGRHGHRHAYVCRQHQRVPAAEACHALPRLDGPTLDSLVWGWVEGTLLEPTALEAGLRTLSNRQDAHDDDTEERAALEAQRADLEAQLANLLDMYLQNRFPAAVLDAKHRALTSAVNACQERLAQLARRAAPAVDEATIQTIVDMSRAIKRLLAEGLTDAERRHVLDLLDVRGTLASTPDGVVVEARCRLSFAAASLVLPSACIGDVPPGRRPRRVAAASPPACRQSGGPCAPGR